MNGILAINGVKLNVVHFTNGIYTDADATGRPWGKPNGGIFSVVIPMTKDNSGITRAALHDTLKVDGNITFYQWDFGKVFSKLEFANAHIVHYSEHYDHQSNEEPMIQLTFSPGIQRLNNDTIFEKPWNTSNPFKDTSSPVSTTKKPVRKKLVNYFVTDAKGNQLSEYKVGEKVILNIETNNRIGEGITISLKNKSHDFKFRGQTLNNDKLSNYIINSDLEQIELDVVNQQ